jgi:hypothetical protein
VTSLSPNTNLNPSGGNELTITGANFPASLNDGSTIYIAFSGGNTCKPYSISTTQIKCLSTAFASGVTTDTLTVTINAQSDSSQTATVTSAPAVITSIQPWLASPVLKTNLTLWVSGFSSTLDPDDLTITLTQQANSSIVKEVNVIDVGTDDNGIKYIVVRFGGAYSGTYDVAVHSATYGHFDTTGITVQTIGTVTSYTPTSGSVYGGTLITITGYNFSTTITDNPV